MDQVHVIRHKVLVEGQSQRRVAREMGVSRLTVRKYVEQTTTERREPEPRARPVWEKVEVPWSPRWSRGPGGSVRVPTSSRSAQRTSAGPPRPSPPPPVRFPVRRGGALALRGGGRCPRNRQGRPSAQRAHEQAEAGRGPRRARDQPPGLATAVEHVAFVGNVHCAAAEFGRTRRTSVYNGVHPGGQNGNPGSSSSALEGGSVLSQGRTGLSVLPQREKRLGNRPGSCGILLATAEVVGAPDQIECSRSGMGIGKALHTCGVFP